MWHRTDPCNCKLQSIPPSKVTLQAIGKRLRATREGERLSLEDLAKRTGMSKTGLWQIEAGRSEPMAMTLIALAVALNVSVDYLLLRDYP